VLYLVEGKAPSPDLASFIEDAAATTQIEDGFCIVRTENERETAVYLASVTRLLQETYTRITTSAPMPEGKKRDRRKSDKPTPPGQFATFKQYCKRVRKF